MKATKNCYTCRERKIGCDRHLPCCHNCHRSNRLCKGYGLKLSWPDVSQDRRRKSIKFPEANLEHRSASYTLLQNGQLPFLNTTVLDLLGGPIQLRQAALSGTIIQNPSIAMLHDDESSLLSYYEAILSRMITTVDDDDNGFRSAILPLALSSQTASSMSLLQATLALSAFHQGRAILAVKYRAAALKSLTKSFQSEASCRTTQFATCMMLCVNGVFDASDRSWNVHLNGARSLLQLTGISATTASLGLTFLWDWFTYHAVLQDYAVGDAHEQAYICDAGEPNDRSIVIGSLGCSREILSYISRINKIRTGSGLAESEVLIEIEEIRQRLQNAEQTIPQTQASSSGLLDIKRIKITAELYRKAALLYLEQVVPDDAYASEHDAAALVDDCIAILKELGLCTSPWPLFILANWCTSDEHRIIILQTLDAMNYNRRIGNVKVIETIIRTLWARVDLLGERKRSYHNLDWRKLLRQDDCMPSFI